MTTWEIYFVLFYLFRNRLSKNLIKNSKKDFQKQNI